MGPNPSGAGFEDLWVRAVDSKTAWSEREPKVNSPNLEPKVHAPAAAQTEAAKEA